MKKRLQKLLTVFILVFAMVSITACKSSEPENVPEPTKEVTEAPTEEPTKEVTEAPTPEPTEEVTEAPTPEPTEEPTAEPTVEPTAEPTAEPTGEESGEGGEVEPTSEPDITGIDDPDENKGLLQTLVTVKEDGINPDAEAAALTFIEASSLKYDADMALSVLAYDETKQGVSEGIATLRKSLDMVKDTMSDSSVDLTEMFKMKVYGVRAVSEDEITEDISMTFLVDPAKLSDYTVFTIGFDLSSVSAFMVNGNTYYLNVLTALYEGSYKAVLMSTIYVDEDPYLSEIEEPEKEPVDYKALGYQLTGSETADEIVDLFIEAFKELDFYKMASVLAVSDEAKEKLFSDTTKIDQAVMLLKLFVTPDTTKISRGDAAEVTGEELDALLGQQGENEAVITDVVKYSVHVEITAMGEPQVSDIVLYVGKYNGEYRVFSNELISQYITPVEKEQDPQIVIVDDEPAEGIVVE